MISIGSGSSGLNNTGNKSKVAVPNINIITKLLAELGGGYSSNFEIDLASMRSEEVFKWFLASLLLGESINEDIATKTYREFLKARILSPQAILGTGREGLVKVLNKIDYGAYAIKIASELIEVAEALMDKYQGDMNHLHFYAKDERDLGKRLRELSKGIKPTTVRMFLREMRDLWEKAEPPITKTAIIASKNLQLLQVTNGAQALEELRVMWEKKGEARGRFSDFEVALSILGKNYCKQKRCGSCLIRDDCGSAR
jgi:hypothetical protein